MPPPGDVHDTACQPVLSVIGADTKPDGGERRRAGPTVGEPTREEIKTCRHVRDRDPALLVERLVGIYRHTESHSTIWFQSDGRTTPAVTWSQPHSIANQSA